MTSKVSDGSASGKISIPVGIEKVLYLAASDAGFKSRLLSRREETLRDERLKLDDSERTLLRAIPSDQLQRMIDRIDPKAHGGRGFLRSVAACTAVLVTTTASVNCATGMRSDDPDDAQVEQNYDGSQYTADADETAPDAEASSGEDAGTLPPDQDSGS